MNVHPSLPDHPKYLLFKEALGHPDALEFLARLWAHCQVKKRGENWGKVTDRYVELSCRWPGPPGQLFSAMSLSYEGKPGWVHRKKTGELVVTGWLEHNHSLMTSWENGKSGGRPARNRVAPAPPHRQPPENPQVPHRQPPENLTGLDVTGRDCTGTEGDNNKRGASPGKSELGANVAAQRSQFAALTARQTDLQARKADWTMEERAEYKKNAALLFDLQKKQRAGDFTPSTRLEGAAA